MKIFAASAGGLRPKDTRGHFFLPEEGGFGAFSVSSARGFLCGRSALKYKRENRNFLYQTFLFRFLGFCLISVLENVERLGTLRKGTAPEYALNRLLEYHKAVRANSPQDAGYCTFHHVLKTKCNAHSHEQLHQVNMTAKQRQHILLAAGITHAAKF